MNKSFPYQPQFRARRERTRAWLNPMTPEERREYAEKLRKERILGNVKAFVIGCFVGIAIQLML